MNISFKLLHRYSQEDIRPTLSFFIFCTFVLNLKFFMKKLLLLLVITSFSLTAQINVGKISLDFGETTSEKDGEIIIIAGEKW